MKKVVCVLIACLFTQVYFLNVSAHNTNYVEDIINTINEEMISNYIYTLQNFGPRITATPSCQQAGQYIYEELYEMGYETRFLPWENSGYSDRNIEAILPGERNDSVIICAHYDSVPTSPGADDNGSGTAAVLAAAKAISEYKDRIQLTYTIRFITFSGEEEGLLGSYSYASNAHNNNAQIVAVLNADMIGYVRSDMGKNRVKIYDDENSAWITNISIDVAKMYEEYIGLNIVRRDAGANSDHWPFLAYGYDAVFFHEYEFNDYYHTSNDTADKIDFNYATRVTRLIVATLIHLANLEITDTEPPSVRIDKPKEGYLYIADREIIRVGKTIIIGKTTIEVNAVDDKTGINRVEIYIDGHLKATLFSHPYKFIWDEFAIFTHKIKVVAYDNAENSNYNEFNVIVFNA